MMTDKICSRWFIYERHPISSPHGRAMGCLLWGFWLHLTSLYRHHIVYPWLIEALRKSLPNRDHGWLAIDLWADYIMDAYYVTVCIERDNFTLELNPGNRFLLKYYSYRWSSNVFRMKTFRKATPTFIFSARASSCLWGHGIVRIRNATK